MTLRIKVRQGGAAGSTTTDYSGMVPLWHGYPFETAQMFAQGTADQCHFTIIDPTNLIRTTGSWQVNAHNVVWITEDASGVERWIHRGRVARKEFGRGAYRAGNSRTVTVYSDDGNVDLNGLALTEPWPRGEETGTNRLIALDAAFLSGSPRLTTDITIARKATTGHLVVPHPVDGEVTMPAKTYEAGTDLMEIIRDCAETEGQAWGVVIHHDGGSHLCMLYCEEDDWDAYPCTLSIDDVAPDELTAFRPHWRQGAALLEDGQDVLSTAVARYGVEGDNDAYVVEHVQANADKNDYWAGAINDATSVTQAQALIRAGHLRAGRANEHRTTAVSIILPASKVHLVEAGMSISIRSSAARAEEGLGNFVTRRIASAKKEPKAPDPSDAGELHYWVHMELARPEKIARERRGVRRTPKAPSPGTEASCTRLYLTNDSAIGTPPSLDAAWESGDSAIYALATAPSASVNGGTDLTAGDTNHDVALYRGTFLVTSDLATILAAGGATIEGHIRARARHGIGVSEASQQHISQMVVRVVQGGTSTVRGTALAAHSLTSLAGGTNWPAQSTYVNRVFPPHGATNVLSAVAGAAANDVLLVEVGYRTFNDAATPHGGGVYVNDTAATDLPDDEVETTNLNSWFDICTAGTAADTTEPTVGEGDDDAGDPDQYAPLSHKHVHGKLSTDALDYHQDTQVDYDNSTSLIPAQNIRDAIDHIGRQNNWTATAAPTTGDDVDDGYSVGSRWIDVTNDKEYVCLDASSGAAVWTETTQSGGGGGSSTFVGVRAYHDANQAMTSGAEVALAFNQESYDTDAFHDLVTNNGRLTIPSGLGGKYHGTVQLRLSDSPGAGSYVAVYKNAGAAGAEIVAFDAIPSTVRAGVTASFECELAEGDYLTVSVAVFSTSENVTANTGHSPIFALHKL